MEELGEAASPYINGDKGHHPASWSFIDLPNEGAR